MDRFILRGMLGVIVLKTLSETPLHGYAIMSKIEEKYGFKPSPGALYPLLKKMVREGLVSVEEKRVGDRIVKVYSLTDKGRAFLNEKKHVSEFADFISQKLRIAREIGLISLVKNLLWLFKNLDNMPRDKLLELRNRIEELNNLISSMRGV
ncbi:PadR family transcriptional regulator [Thermogladius sp. 4427co]|uniref:PadR family transcriptional regulator n=1 Tax=Thermogladius sp. 4427co TaxID=3450718 RepID=UPI003F79DF9C